MCLLRRECLLRMLWRRHRAWPRHTSLRRVSHRPMSQHRETSLPRMVRRISRQDAPHGMLRRRRSRMAALGRSSDESTEGLHRVVCPKLGVRKRSTPRVSSSAMLILHREHRRPLNPARLTR